MKLPARRDAFGLLECREVEPLIVVTVGIVIVVGEKTGVLDVGRTQEEHQGIRIFSLVLSE